jgi:hypothetical protein
MPDELDTERLLELLALAAVIGPVARSALEVFKTFPILDALALPGIWLTVRERLGGAYATVGKVAFWGAMLGTLQRGGADAQTYLTTALALPDKVHDSTHAWIAATAVQAADQLRVRLTRGLAVLMSVLIAWLLSPSILRADEWLVTGLLAAPISPAVHELLTALRELVNRLRAQSAEARERRSRDSAGSS